MMVRLPSAPEAEAQTWRAPRRIFTRARVAVRRRRTLGGTAWLSCRNPACGSSLLNRKNQASGQHSSECHGCEAGHNASRGIVERACRLPALPESQGLERGIGKRRVSPQEPHQGQQPDRGMRLPARHDNGQEADGARTRDVDGERGPGELVARPSAHPHPAPVTGIDSQGPANRQHHHTAPGPHHSAPSSGNCLPRCGAEDRSRCPVPGRLRD
jgi:hypothetical protein